MIKTYMNPTSLSELNVGLTMYILKSFHFNQIALETILWNKIKKYVKYAVNQYKMIYWIKDGKKEGPYKIWYSTGQIYGDCNYKNGKLEGHYKYWYNNGQIWEEKFYTNGYLIGPIKAWHTDGTQMGELLKIESLTMTN